MGGVGGSELREEKEDLAKELAAEEPKDSDLFISGGERREETVSL